MERGGEWEFQACSNISSMQVDVEKAWRSLFTGLGPGLSWRWAAGVGRLGYVLVVGPARFMVISCAVRHIDLRVPNGGD